MSEAKKKGCLREVVEYLALVVAVNVGIWVVVLTFVNNDRLTAIETQLAIDANCIATLEELHRAGERAQGEAGE